MPFTGERTDRRQVRILVHGVPQVIRFRHNTVDPTGCVVVYLIAKQAIFPFWHTERQTNVTIGRLLPDQLLAEVQAELTQTAVEVAQAFRINKERMHKGYGYW